MALLFAFGASLAPNIARAQDMPPILAPLDVPVIAPAPAPKVEPVTPAPSAQATIPPPSPVAAPPAPAKKPQVAAAHPAHQHAKFTALVKKLTAAHDKAGHDKAGHDKAGPHRVALKRVEPTRPQAMAAIGGPSLPPGTLVGPPPGYYGPREHLVYAAPPQGYYGWGGYRGRYYAP
jgi:hypothetical protein